MNKQILTKQHNFNKTTYPSWLVPKEQNLQCDISCKRVWHSAAMVWRSWACMCMICTRLYGHTPRQWDRSILCHQRMQVEKTRSRCIPSFVSLDHAPTSSKKLQTRSERLEMSIKHSLIMACCLSTGCFGKKTFNQAFGKKSAMHVILFNWALLRRNQWS